VHCRCPAPGVAIARTARLESLYGGRKPSGRPPPSPRRPDEETGAAFNLQPAASSNLRSVTMPAFNEDEMSGIIEKMD
jgi:hypothetical protein